MNSEQEILKTFTCFFFESASCSKVADVELPVNRPTSKCKNRVNEALLEGGFLPDSSAIQLYKPLQPLRIATTTKDLWLRSIDFDKSPAFKLLRRQVFSTEFDDELLNCQEIVQLVVVAPRKKVTLNYILFNADDGVRFVSLPASGIIGDCSEQIFQELQNKKVIANIISIDLCKAPPGISIIRGDKIEWPVTLRLGDSVLPKHRKLYESFSEEEFDNDQVLHLIAVAKLSKPAGVSSKAEEMDTIAPLQEFCGTRYRKFYKAYTGSAKTPSTAAMTTEFRKIQRGHIPIYDGRRAPGVTSNSSTIAMPPSLYHPVFERWKKNACDPSIEPPAASVVQAAALMRKATILHETKYLRSKALSEPLQHLLGKSVVNADETLCDGHITFLLKRGAMTYNVPLLIVEEKNDRKEGTDDEGTDPTTQAIFSMIQAWTDADLRNLLNLTCCPTFLLGFNGCQLTIAAAVLTDKCIVERLETLWIGRSSTFDLNRIESVARVFHVLSSALEELKEWYQLEIIASRTSYDPDANRPYNHPRFFPHADQYPVEGEDFSHTIKFQYLHPLETSSLCTTFLARATTNPVDIFVVKFTQRYCPALHSLLADRGMAPALRYCGKIDERTPYENWQMVVMDYFEGGQATEEQPTRKAVEEAVKIGHAAGFVFGDVRRANALVGRADGEVKLIDFDWAGEAGRVRYPPDMSDNHDLWVVGMTPMVLIEKKHDLAMIEKWFPN